MSDRAAALNLFKHAQEMSQRQTAEIPNRDQLTYQFLQSALHADPTWPEIWWQIAAANSDQRLSPAAVASYRRMLELPDGPDFTKDQRVKALVNIAHRLHYSGKNDEAFGYCQHAINLDPGDARAHCNMSLILSVDGHLADAVAHARTAKHLDPEDSAADIALAFALMFSGEYAEGLKYFEKRFDHRIKVFKNYPYPKWQGESGKMLFLTSDQGIGDALSFSRFVPLAAKQCSHIFIHCQGELVNLFRDSFDGMNITVHALPGVTCFPAADYWTTFVSLPTSMGLSNQEIIGQPGIPIVDYAGRPTWKDESRKLHIGIAWAGHATADIDQWRTIPVTQFLELYKVTGVQLYSLQVGERASDLHVHGCATLIRDLSANIRDVCDTIAIIKDLDMVICVESAIGHICGAIGAKTWIPYSYYGRDYRMGHTGEKPLWYPNHCGFKQGPDGDWGPVFNRMVHELETGI